MPLPLLAALLQAHAKLRLEWMMEQAGAIGVAFSKDGMDRLKYEIEKVQRPVKGITGIVETPPLRPLGRVTADMADRPRHVVVRRKRGPGGPVYPTIALPKGADSAMKELRQRFSGGDDA